MNFAILKKVIKTVNKRKINIIIEKLSRIELFSLIVLPVIELPNWKTTVNKEKTIVKTKRVIKVFCDKSTE